MRIRAVFAFCSLAHSEHCPNSSRTQHAAKWPACINDDMLVLIDAEALHIAHKQVWWIKGAKKRDEKEACWLNSDFLEAGRYLLSFLKKKFFYIQIEPLFSPLPGWICCNVEVKVYSRRDMRALKFDVCALGK